MSEIEEISQDFFKENETAIGQSYLCQSVPKSHNVGPYTRDEKIKRINEVGRLHFDYGYSARKISEFMKISRNTVNSDLEIIYSKAFKEINILNPVDKIVSGLFRLDTQRTRLRETLDKISSISDKLYIEKLILDIDVKIMNTYSRVQESMIKTHTFGIKFLNQELEKQGSKSRYITFLDTIAVSKNTKARIEKILEDDRLQ